MKNDDLKETVKIPEEFLTRLTEIRKQYETIIERLNEKIDHLEKNESVDSVCLEIIEDIVDFLFLIVSNRTNKTGQRVGRE